ncbi:Replication factor A protein 1 [Chytriomyces hyalinus]|nr:Replication factor A protein 1 [Chytriomyces hyalinus]
MSEPITEALLSRGSIYRLSAQGLTETPTHLQVLNVKTVKGTNDAAATERYRVILSDGVHAMQGMLATQLNHLITSNQIVKHSVVRIDKMLCNEISGKRILIILDLVTLNPGDENCPRLGNPMMEITAPPPPLETQQPKQQQQQQYQAPQYQQQQQQQQQQYNQSVSNNQQRQVPQQQQQQQNRNSHQQQANPNDVAVFPIKSLSPYQNKWTIRARLISKSDIRTYNNAKGPGQLFSMTFGDDSGEIRATGFNDTVTHFYDMLVENKVYYVSKAQIKVANRNYSGGINNDYEMTLDLGTIITECNDKSAMPQILIKRVMLNQLMEYEKDHTIDLVAVVTDVQPPTEITTKAGKQLLKREIVVADESNYSCRLTLWGRQAETFQDLSADNVTSAASNPIYIFKGVRVNDFGGRSLSMPAGGTVIFNPDSREAHAVRGWWMNEGVNGGVASYSNGGAGGGGGGSGGQVAGVRGFKLISSIAEENMGHGEKPDWLSIRATISFIKSDRDMWYPACQSPDCQKKVTQTESGWRCEKCNKSFPTPKYRYIFNCKVLDHSTETWVGFFNDTAEALFGMSANDLQMIQQNEPERYKSIVDSAQWRQLNLRVRAKAEAFQDDLKVRVSVQSMEPINYAAAAIDLADAIAAYA